MISRSTRPKSRERRTLDSSILISGADQSSDFVVPLFAGTVLGLTVWETAVLIGVSSLAAFLTRPIAGIVVDRFVKSAIAAAGAGCSGVGYLLYATATGMPIALLAAATCGAASAFAWVAIRAIVGERLAEDSGVFARLVAAEETGGWLVLVPVIVLLALTDYRWVFLSLAACCFLAAGVLLAGRGRGRLRSAERPAPHTLTPGSRPGVGLLRKLRPMLLAVLVTMTAEAAISLLLLLHLQRELGLGILEIAAVFLPGAIVMSVAPPYLHRFVVRFGRRKILVLGALLSSIFAVGLALAPTPGWIAALWVCSALAWSAVMPVQQAVIAEASGHSFLGRGLGLYEAAGLAGAVLGTLGAGLLFSGNTWLVACLVFGALSALGAVLVPAAVNRLGVSPVAAAVPRELSGGLGSASPSLPGGPKTAVTRGKPPAQKTRRQLGTELLQHTLLLAVALLLAWALLPGFSMLQALGIGADSVGLVDRLSSAVSGEGTVRSLVEVTLRLWVVVYLVDLVWTSIVLLRPTQS